MQGTILVNRYELIEKIGEGGMAVVYKAKCQILDRIVAVKILKEEFSNDSNFIEKFRTEAHSAAKLSHPNIVNIFDVGEENNIHFIVMEFIEGETLKELIAKKSPLTNNMALDIAVAICDGIHHAHEKGIIHKDIKPHNILITSSGIVKVADFGIAHATSNKTITFGGGVVGSVHYISPEQAKGEPVTRATDIYSVGCVLYEMLTGKVPFDAESPITIALKHIHDDPILPHELNPQISAELENVILKAISKIPSYRYNSAEEMKDSLLYFSSSKNNKYEPNHENGKTLIMPALSNEGNDEYLRKRRVRTGRITILIVAIVGLLSGILFMGFNNFFGTEVLVPDIVGQDIKEARAELEKHHLKILVDREEFNHEYDPDQVISQEPKDGMKVKSGREIKVVLSKGLELYDIPNVVGHKIDEAKLLIVNEGFEVGNTDKIYDSKYGENVVISQDPVSGKKAEKNTKINLMISQGEPPERIPMPELIGLNLNEARNVLKENNLILKEIEQEESSEYFSNIVIKQDTGAGVLIDEETSVVLTVSKGPGPVAQTRAIEFELPHEQDYYKVVIRVTDAKGKNEVYNELHQGGETIYVGISYYSPGKAEVLLNGKLYDTFNL